jgi:hypothetical protein
MQQAAPVSIPLRRVFVSPQSFKSHSDNLSRLHSALEGIGTRLSSISGEDTLPTWLAFELNGIGSTLECLGAMARSASGDAEEWQMWAEGDRVKDALDTLWRTR